MAHLLSAAELDVLRETSPENQTGRYEPKPGTVSAYNFRRPDRVSKEQIRSLHLLHDRFARNATTSLAAYLRAITELSVVSVEQFSYSEFLMSLTDPTAFYALAIPPLDDLAVPIGTREIVVRSADRRERREPVEIRVGEVAVVNAEFEPLANAADAAAGMPVLQAPSLRIIR